MLNKGGILLGLLLIFQFTYAQTKAKKFEVKVGFGVKPTFLHNTPSSGYPINFHGEYFFNSKISGGAFLGFAQSAITYHLLHWCDLQNGNGYYLHYYDHYSWSFTLSGVRTCYHFTDAGFEDKYDFYAGAGIGIIRVHANVQSLNPFGLNTLYHPAEYKNGYFCSVFAGMRCKMDEHAALFAEFGYGVSYANVGISYRF